MTDHSSSCHRVMHSAKRLLLAAGLALAAAACGGGTGVCTACCGPTGRTYCKDGWTKSECDDWSAQQVNGLSWSFFEGQTCAERGTPATP